jgi:hypothetical protein
MCLVYGLITKRFLQLEDVGRQHNRNHLTHR